MKILILIDCQNDFIDGALGTECAQAVVPNIVKKINNYDYHGVFLTLDTHYQGYLKTPEGQRLPVVHCVKYQNGWNINKDIYYAVAQRVGQFNVGAHSYEKTTFGSVSAMEHIINNVRQSPIYDSGATTEYQLVGFCTDVCLVSNALILKALEPNCTITVDASCCAGTTPDKHLAALDVMRSCQINIIND